MNCKNIILLFFSAFIILSCKTHAPLPPPRPTPRPVPAATPAPAPIVIPAVIEKPQTVIKFHVEPSQFYKDEYGYIGIEYRTKEEIWERRKPLLAARNLSQTEYDRIQNSIPKDGMIYVHIGRQDLMHANTRYYSFRGDKDNRGIFMIHGREGIPNLRSVDRNWWNIVEVPLRENIDDVINVVVTDKKINREFSFKIQKDFHASERATSCIMKAGPADCSKNSSSNA